MLGVSCTSIGVLFLLLIMICAISEGFKYRMKFMFFMIISTVSSIIFLPFMLFRIRSWKNALLPALTITWAAKVIGITYHVRGKENIVQDSGCIVLINHQSLLDLCALGELWPVLKKCVVISKKEILYLGTFGLASWLWGTIFINRGSAEESHNTLNATAKIIKDSNAKLLMFPEGKRYSGSTLMPFKKGGFHLAIASQTPIQPVIISKYYFLNDKLKKFDSGTSYITILPPIPTQGFTKEDLPKLIDLTYETMNTAFVQTSQEALSKHVDRLKNE